MRSLDECSVEFLGCERAIVRFEAAGDRCYIGPISRDVRRGFPGDFGRLLQRNAALSKNLR
jgi:hypothetical protein